MPDDTDILKRIADASREDLAERKRRTDERELLEEAASRPAAKSLSGALKSGNGLRIIAELKQASPSKGLIRPDFRIGELAQEYLEAGAAAIS